MNSSNNNNDRTPAFMWDRINDQTYPNTTTTTTTTASTATINTTADNNNSISNNISVMPKLNRLNIAALATSTTTPADLVSLSGQQQLSHPDMNDPSKRRRIDHLPIIDSNNHSQHHDHQYHQQQLPLNNSNNNYTRPLFSSLPARMYSNHVSLTRGFFYSLAIRKKKEEIY